ncbi:AbrB/MazE/SpoVT family DNA-binding domain-containing protein [Natrarchaeobius halalkaliphilus]|uniref:AbrB/MazE/SpoVT family DNA-binding domain-containing protein n=1 Tax=Natrarchaeobius halalkaliphilus TaxID=1679091 RepID=A0A3N6MTF6_9EURY|nr:AbrB/MazE/SpoVT family DNA-binding domain-containing protein [Natrarchaeobius halalkaliphilus]RQG88085.1 AbrB/MazE/SpoVT family DNA-binding domain-containing protein [Natrarchaeobius halalkaliphilus]
MSSSTRDPEVVRVSQKGQATIPKTLRKKFGIDTPGEVFIYEEDERIIVEPVPSLEELGGIHADTDHEHGDVLDRVRELKHEERRREDARADRLRPADSEDE